MFICFTNQGKILGVFQRQKIISAIFNGKVKKTTVLCKIAGKEEIFIFPSTLTDFARFTKKLRKNKTVLPRYCNKRA